MPSETPFLTFKVECPVCKTINEFEQVKVGAFTETGRDTDFCPQDIQWRSPRYQAHNPLLYFTATCSNCFYTRELTNTYREWKTDNSFRTFKLKNIKSRKVYAKPFLVTLEDETMIWVERFEMQMTHAGMIEGLPSESHVKRRAEAAEKYVREEWRGRSTKLIQPKVYDARSKQPILPSLTMMAQLRSYERRNDDEDGTWLNLVWFADIDDQKSVTDFVAYALQQIDWKAEAYSYWI